MSKIRICSCGKKMTDDQMLLFAIYKVCLHNDEEIKGGENGKP